MKDPRPEMEDMAQDQRIEIQNWHVIAAIGFMLLVPLDAVWGIVAAYAP